MPSVQPSDFVDDDPTRPNSDPEPEPEMHPDDLRRMREVEAWVAARRRPLPLPVETDAEIAARRLDLLRQVLDATPQRFLLPEPLREALAAVDNEVRLSHKKNA